MKKRDTDMTNSDNQTTLTPKIKAPKIKVPKIKAVTSTQTQITQPSFSANNSFKSLADSVDRASTVVFDSVAALRARDWRDKNQYTYGLLGTPTTRQLERQLALIDKVNHVILAPSGSAAINLVMLSLLKTGDSVLLPNNVYAPALDFAKYLHAQYGVNYALYDPTNLADLTIPKNTTLIWVETPGSITMEVADLPAIAAIAHAQGAVVAVDATWAAGIALPVFALGADIAIQALTKYQSGGSDVMMGSVSTPIDAIYAQLASVNVTLGTGISPEDCRLILRSLPHYALRYAAQDKAAQHIARWFATQVAVEQVLHPALEGAPGHDIWRRDFSGAASLFSVVFKAQFSQSQIDACVEALQLFHLGFSWGGAVSLVVPFTRNQMHANYSYSGLLVRFYIGLEDVNDLLHDIEQAFKPLNKLTE